MYGKNTLTDSIIIIVSTKTSVFFFPLVATETAVKPYILVKYSYTSFALIPEKYTESKSIRTCRAILMVVFNANITSTSEFPENLSVK